MAPMFARALADVGRAVAARRRGAGPLGAVRQHGVRRRAGAPGCRGRGRRRRPREADRRRPPRLGQGFVAEAVDAVPAGAAPRRQRQRPRRAGHRRRHGGLLGDVRAGAASAGSATSRSPRPGLWGQGPVLLQSLAMLDDLPDDAARPVDRRRRAHRRRGAQARLRRPRGVVRRRRRRADRRRCSTRRTSPRAAPWSAPSASRELRPGSPGGREPRIAAHVHKASERATCRSVSASRRCSGER